MSNTTLDTLKKEVHKSGFNISRMINRFKKDQRKRKAIYEIPDEVLENVCREVLIGRHVTDPYPYFMKVLHLKSHEYFANKNITDNNKNKFSRTMPQHLADILNPRR